MAEEFIRYGAKDPEQSIMIKTPSGIALKKSAMLGGSTGFLLFIALASIHLTIGIETLLMPFEGLGIHITKTSALIFLSVIIIITSIIFFFSSYLPIKGLVIEIMIDRLKISKSTFLTKDSEEIMFQNISNISFSKEGFFSKMFGLGNLSLTLTGLEKEKVDIEDVFNIEEAVKIIQERLQSIRARIQAQYAANSRISSIMDNI